MLIIKNANVYDPDPVGIRDILIVDEKIISIEEKIKLSGVDHKVWDAQGKTITSGLIDQHIHTIGAGGKHGFSSMTPEIMLSQLIACGSTTVVGLLGTDGTTRSVKTLYGKTKALDKEGITSYMFTGYYGLETTCLMNSIQEDMIFFDKVLGCKVAICDIRSSYPTALELVRILKQVRVGGMIGGKKGILHIHLGNLADKMDLLFELVNKYEFPIAHISPTHVGRTKDLFYQAIEFGKMGGMIDITTGASKYTEPYKAVLTAFDKGLSVDQITFSSDGNAGLEKLDGNKNLIGFRRAPIDRNLGEVQDLVNTGGVPFEKAIKIITCNPARNLGLKHKGYLRPGYDADLCLFDDQLKLTDVFARGKIMMENNEILVNGSFE
jgi:beta-aspartyl-dipeptidase (metallo-type)